ncbi:hypothetical protein JCM10449v2_000923 [Rhodotorula kratochvilovae]
MAPHGAYPRSTLSTILRTHAASPKASLAPETDVVAFISFLAFLRQLAREAETGAVDGSGRAAKGKAAKVWLERGDVERAAERFLQAKNT